MKRSMSKSGNDVRCHKTFHPVFLVILIISMILLFSTAACTAEEGQKNSVTLSYSSFDGGGYYYSVQVADEAILSTGLRYEYGSPNHEMEDGSPFDALITLTAIKPGETEVIIRWESPILPPGEAHYLAVIGDDLTIELKEEPYMRVSIYDVPFVARLEDNGTAAAFAALLPMRLDMDELNGNEIYHYLPEPLPSAPERVGHVNAGDIMLYGDSCVVIFYESFDTPYSYTPIGNIADAEGLAAEIAGEGAYVTFETMNY